MTEHLGLQVVDVGDGSASNGSADKVNLASVNVLDNHDLHLGKEVKSEL